MICIPSILFPFSSCKHSSSYSEIIHINQILLRNSYLSYLDTGENLSTFFAFINALKSIAAMLIEATSGNGSSSITLTSFFSRNFSVPFDPVLDNIPKTSIRIIAMILGVVILIVYFSPNLLFFKELVILGKCDESLLQ